MFKRSLFTHYINIGLFMTNTVYWIKNFNGYARNPSFKKKFIKLSVYILKIDHYVATILNF